mmetsp:Transcript_13194/g.39875  ORF Transcript_13194/g.39875 Transcript_13194/m.39875 type:complete len:228 (-) Transcript_13194:3029-3712(-)
MAKSLRERGQLNNAQNLGLDKLIIRTFNVEKLDSPTPITVKHQFVQEGTTLNATQVEHLVKVGQCHAVVLDPPFVRAQRNKEIQQTLDQLAIGCDQLDVRWVVTKHTVPEGHQLFLVLIQFVMITIHTDKQINEILKSTAKHFFFFGAMHTEGEHTEVARQSPMRVTHSVWRTSLSTDTVATRVWQQTQQKKVELAEDLLFGGHSGRHAQVADEFLGVVAHLLVAGQ